MHFYKCGEFVKKQLESNNSPNSLDSLWRPHAAAIVSLLPFNSIDGAHIPSFIVSCSAYFDILLPTTCLIPNVNMALEKRSATDGLTANPGKRPRNDDNYSRSKRVLFYIPDSSTTNKKVKMEFLLTDKFAGICYSVFDAGVYYYNKKFDYGRRTTKWAIQQAKDLGYNMTEEIFLAIFQVSQFQCIQWKLTVGIHY